MDRLVKITLPRQTAIDLEIESDFLNIKQKDAILEALDLWIKMRRTQRVTLQGSNRSWAWNSTEREL